MNNTIVKGSVVKHTAKSDFSRAGIKTGDTRYYRVTATFKNTANIGGIFNGIIYFKSVPLTELVEAHDEWYDKWQQSETYQSM